MMNMHSEATSTKQERSGLDITLPHELIIHIIGLITVTSTQPIADLNSIRATSKAMYAASKKRHVRRRAALNEKEAGTMRWCNNGCYHAMLESLTVAGNLEACFVTDITL